ncbi:MAG: DNA polymerase III subunit beta [Synergistaceae bacterium]|jgi:DNA polymerase-3 subunit beta|nr:DNA polymerase III subunit beta [Synergistaceae bacterium]
MKLKVDKASFIKSWSLAERSAGTASSMNIFSTVRLQATLDGVELQSTDIKTSIKCAAQGVEVLEPGEAIIPIKGVSDLFKKAGSPEFIIQVDEGKALMTSGRSRYRFSTYQASEFPNLPSASGGSLFCTIKSSLLSASIDRGTLCASEKEEFPQYLSSAYFEMEDGLLNIVTTDKRRLALSKAEVIEAGSGNPMLLPIKSVKEFQRILGIMESDSDIKILFDDAQAYFVGCGMEFAVRKVETNFPPYAKILPTTSSTTVHADRQEITSALERVDVVVRDYNRTVIMMLREGGDCVLSGRAPEFGEAVENITCDVSGETLKSGFNTKYFLDAVKAIEGPVASLTFNGAGSHMVVRQKDSDSFLCMVAPMELSREEIESEEADHEGDVF